MNNKLNHIKETLQVLLATWVPSCPIIGVITIGGMDATAVLFTFGLMYILPVIFTGFLYQYNP